MARWEITVVVEGERLGEVTLRFSHSPVTIGGAASNDVVLAGPHVSRSHAIVAITGDRLVYQDRSRNGSFVNNQPIRETTLQPGDVVVVPPYRMKFALVASNDEGTRPLPASSLSAPGPAPAKTTAASLRLVHAPGGLLNQSFVLDEKRPGDALTIGRTVEADICLDVPSVSRNHATLAAVGRGRWKISDQGSRNGIAVNGASVDAAVLVDGDRIAFGPDVTAVFEQGEVAEPGSPPAPADPDTQALTLTERRSAFDGAVMIVSVRGRIDGYNYAEFRERLNRLIDAGEHLLAVDFSQCAFCDHVGLGVVLSTKTALDQHRGRLCLIGVDDRLREGMALLRLDTLLAMEADEEAAVRRLLR
jgi:anti-anti-sigma factor